MTYTYLLTLPLITIYSVANAVIKYQEGFVYSPQHGVMPKPYDQWTKPHQDAVFPLMMLLAACFSFEMITHLEELCFWIYLMNATASSEHWFRSVYFVIWSCGSVVALIFVPTVTIVFRNDPSKDEAYTFLIGSCGSLTLTICFVPILYLFPKFLHNLVTQGLDKATVIRLQKFHELNRLRFVFKLLWVLPLITLGIDGLKPHTHTLNESMFWTEVLGMASAFGCVLSSAITLLIFFPRNEEGEYESSSLGRLNRLEMSRRKDEQHHGRDLSGSSYQRNHHELGSETSIGSSPDPRIYVSELTSRSRTDDECGPPPRYQAPAVRIVVPDRNGDRIVELSTPLASAVTQTTLRPNRLGPNGDIELGGLQENYAAGEWITFGHLSPGRH